MDTQRKHSAKQITIMINNELARCRKICFNKGWAAPPMSFKSNKGRSAGKCSVNRLTGKISLSFNYGIASHPDNFELFRKTVAHEFAHAVDWYNFDNLNHGIRWKRIFASFGYTPDRCHNYNMESAKLNKRSYVHYTCGCKDYTHNITKRMHSSIAQGKKVLSCRTCGTFITNDSLPTSMKLYITRRNDSKKQLMSKLNA